LSYTKTTQAMSHVLWYGYDRVSWWGLWLVFFCFCFLWYWPRLNSQHVVLVSSLRGFPQVRDGIVVNEHKGLYNFSLKIKWRNYTFITVFYISHNRVFNNEYNSYPKISVKRTLVYIYAIERAFVLLDGSSTQFFNNDFCQLHTDAWWILTLSVYQAKRILWYCWKLSENLL